MRCDQCRHWNKDSKNQEWEAQRAGFGECLAVRERWTIMDEAGQRDYSDGGGVDAYTQRRIENLKAARAYVQDGSEYRAELYTAPDFFCALFSVSVDWEKLREEVKTQYPEVLAHLAKC